MTLRFGAFEVDTATRQLRRDGTAIHLSRKAFDLLNILLTRRPTVVPKEDLYKELWPDTFVTDANLMVLVGEVRRALGDNAHAPQFIRTAHGVGYAFCGAARELGESARPSEPRVQAWLVSEGRTFKLPDGEYIIGRDPQADLWLDDDSVSRRHARLRVTNDGGIVVLHDLQSTNGTFIGRKRVASETTLQHGDVVKIGSVTMEFRSLRDEPPPTKRIRRSGR